MVIIKYILVFFLFGLWISQASFGIDKINPDLVWSQVPLEDSIQIYVEYILGFLYIVAVVIWIFGWFTILTAAWDDEKVKKGRDYIIYMVLGLILIFIAWSIVQLVIESILEPRLKSGNNLNL